MINKLKAKLKKRFPKLLLMGFRLFNNPKDISALLQFVRNKNLPISFQQRCYLIKKMYQISYHVDCPHTQHEIISFINAILLAPKEAKGCVVEAGCFKGGSTAKFSIAAKMVNRKLMVFDSFEGIPENDELHNKNIFGGDAAFPKGSFCGALNEVKSNVEKFGDINSCVFIKGWFDNTLPAFSTPVLTAYIDVDLASSTKTCLKYFYPLLIENGTMFSQDGHLPLVIEVLKDDKFWLHEVGFSKPEMLGIGRDKLIFIQKKNQIFS
ncbi:MAG: hypothetical protein RI955_1575 [Bacteroidota bacterium]